MSIRRSATWTGNGDLDMSMHDDGGGGEGRGGGGSQGRGDRLSNDDSGLGVGIGIGHLRHHALSLSADDELAEGSTEEEAEAEAEAEAKRARMRARLSTTNTASAHSVVTTSDRHTAGSQSDAGSEHGGSEHGGSEHGGSDGGSHSGVDAGSSRFASSNMVVDADEQEARLAAAEEARAALEEVNTHLRERLLETELANAEEASELLESSKKQAAEKRHMMALVGSKQEEVATLRAALETQVGHLQGEASRLRGDKDSYRTQVENLQRRLSEVAAERHHQDAEAHAEATRENRSAAALEADVELAQRSCQRLESALANTESDLATLSQQEAAAVSTAEVLQRRVDEVETQLAIARRAEADAAADGGGGVSPSGPASSTAAPQWGRLKGQRSPASEAAAAETETETETHTPGGTAKLSLDDLLNPEITLHAQLEAAEDEAQTLRCQVEDLEGQLVAARRENTALQRQLRSYQVLLGGERQGERRGGRQA